MRKLKLKMDNLLWLGWKFMIVLAYFNYSSICGFKNFTNATCL